MISETPKIALARALAEASFDAPENKKYLAHLGEQARKMHTENAAIAEYLRDILPETPITEATIWNLFGNEVTEAVKLLARSGNEMYLAYVDRLASNPICREVELAEVEYKILAAQLGDMTYEDFKNRKVYRIAGSILESARP